MSNSPVESRIAIAKLDAKKQIAYGMVYLPYVPDSQGDFMTPEEIERVAHNFLKKGAVEAIDTEHSLVRNGSAAVESFIARPGDPDFVPGSWVLGVHIPDKGIWAKAESGELGGFSMYGTGRRQQRIVEIEVPDEGVLFGKTEATGGAGAHEHIYALDFNDKGDFLGGETDEINGHTHMIRKGTVTEPGPDGHRHRFSFVDTLAKGCGPLSEEQKGWQKKRKALRKAWDEASHPRGKTTPESRGGSFAPSGGSSGEGGGYKTIQGATPIIPWVVAHTVLQRMGTDPVATKEYGDDFTHWANEKFNSDAKFRASVMDERDSQMAGDGAAGRDFLYRQAEDYFKQNKPMAMMAERKPAELTPSGHRPLSTIAREIRRDWGPKVYFGAKPYLDALSSMYDVKEPYYEDSGSSVVAYLLGNMQTWRGPKAKEIKAELKKILKVRKEDMSADELPEDAGQDEEPCKDCQTPKACRHAGHCLISDEEDEEDTADDEDVEKKACRGKKKRLVGKVSA